MSLLPRKTLLCGIFILLVFGGIFTISMLAACPVQKPACPDQRDPVAFPHDLHMGQYDCLACHHVYDRQHNNILDPSELYAGNPHVQCASCHDAQSRITRQEAFHQQCIGCHAQTGGIARPGGPSLCGQCHKDQSDAPEFVMILGEPHD